MRNEDKCRLELLGITYNQIESGIYAVILQEVGGDRRLPIVIGYPEAQSIECVLQQVKPQRPLTHDMMIDTLERFGIVLREIEIYRMDNGVFAATLIMEGPDGVRMEIDSRSSDGIALAIRCGAPIYTSLSVMEEAGFEPEKKGKGVYPEPKVRGKVKKTSASALSKESELESMTRDQLIHEMEASAAREDYERAAKIKAELERRGQND